MFYTHIQIPPSRNWDPAVIFPQVQPISRPGCRLSKGGRLRQSIDVIARRQAAWFRMPTLKKLLDYSGL